MSRSVPMLLVVLHACGCGAPGPAGASAGAGAVSPAEALAAASSSPPAERAGEPQAEVPPDGPPAADGEGSPGSAEEDPLPPPLGVHAIVDAELREVWGALSGPLLALVDAAPGIVSVPELDGRRLGRTYGSLEALLDAGAPGETLVRLARAHLRPSPGDFVFYATVGTGPCRRASQIASAFDVESELAPAEAAALDVLVRTLEAQLRSHPGIAAYSLQAGWADAVGSAIHGVALVAPGGGEVLWLHAEEVWYEG